MRCAACDERFSPREETVMHETEDTLRRFHPSCFEESDHAGNGTARWSGGPPYTDIVMLPESDFKKLVSDTDHSFDLERLKTLEKENRDRDEIVSWLDSKIKERGSPLDKVEQLE